MKAEVLYIRLLIDGLKVANGVIHYLPNSRIEALGRVPPKKKIGQVRRLITLYCLDSYVQRSMFSILRMALHLKVPQ